MAQDEDPPIQETKTLVNIDSKTKTNKKINAARISDDNYSVDDEIDDQISDNYSVWGEVDNEILRKVWVLGVASWWSNGCKKGGNNVCREKRKSNHHLSFSLNSVREMQNITINKSWWIDYLYFIIANDLDKLL